MPKPKITIVKQFDLNGRPINGTTRPYMWLVKKDNVVIGYVTKYKNTKTDKHPHKAFKFIKPNLSEFLGITYKGGLKTAINAIVKNERLIDDEHLTSHLNIK